MKELLEKLKSLDSTAYESAFNWLKSVAWILISDKPEGYFLEDGPYPLRDALLQACLQDTVSGKGWFFYIQWDIHYGWLASINEQEEPCEGDSPAKSLLSAYIAACEANR
jgi:hypothetical protein